MAEDGGFGAVDVIADSVGFRDRRMKLPSSNSQHKLSETAMWWTEKDQRSLLETLGDRKFRCRWIRWEADITVLHFGQWDILRNNLGEDRPMDFVEDVIFHTKLFIEKSKYYTSEAQRISYEDRMKHHLFVLIAPKRSERFQTFIQL